jgi:hypothetical protein
VTAWSSPSGLRSTTSSRNHTRRAGVDPLFAVTAIEQWEKTVDSVGEGLVRPGAAILIAIGRTRLGGVCGWLLRDRLVARKNETLRESTYLQTLPADARARSALRQPNTLSARAGP